MAQGLCRRWLAEHDPPSTSRSAHGVVTPHIDAVLAARLPAPQRDLIMSELLEALWTVRPLEPRVSLRVLHATSAHHLPRTRCALHRRLCAPPPDAAPPTRRMWNALLQSHAQARDWTLFDEAMRLSEAAHAINGADIYHYALLRLQYMRRPHDDIFQDVHAILKNMQDSGIKLNDATLARLLRALAVPVREARRHHARPASLERTTAPLLRIVQVLYEWLSDPSVSVRGTGAPYRESLAVIFELQLLICRVQHEALRHEARVAHEPCAPFPAASAVAPLAAELERMSPMLRSDNGCSESVCVDLAATGGDLVRAVALLDRWIAASTSPEHRRAQRRALVLVFSQACADARPRRLDMMLRVLELASNPVLWHGTERGSSPSTTLVRLWTRFIGAWTHSVGVRRGKHARRMMQTSALGWPLMDRALRALTRVSGQVPASRWSSLYHHPERCRALVSAATATTETTALQRLAKVHACFQALRVPPRTWRYAAAAEHAAAAVRAERLAAPEVPHSTLLS